MPVKTLKQVRAKNAEIEKTLKSLPADASLEDRIKAEEDAEKLLWGDEKAPADIAADTPAPDSPPVADTETPEIADDADKDASNAEAKPEVAADESTETADTKAEAEDWTKGDDDKEDDGKGAPNSLAQSVRIATTERVSKKFRAQIAETSEENQKLKAEVAELKKRLETPAPALPVQQKPRPDRNAYKSDVEYEDALYDWRRERDAAVQTSEQIKQQKQAAQQEIAARINAGVERHYEEVAAVAAQMPTLTEQQWQAADRAFRQAVEEVFPGRGDLMADALIANIGKGSAKVVYQVGVNKIKRAELVALLKEDRLGHSAIGFLNRLAVTMGHNTKAVSKAPTPPPTVQGDKGKKGVGMLKAQYLDAVKKGDTQRAFRISREAKAQGHNTRDW